MMMMQVDVFPKQTILRVQEDLDLNEKIDLAENATSRETSTRQWLFSPKQCLVGIIYFCSFSKTL